MPSLMLAPSASAAAKFSVTAPLFTAVEPSVPSLAPSTFAALTATFSVTLKSGSRGPRSALSSPVKMSLRSAVKRPVASASAS